MTGWERISLERTGGFAGTPLRVQVGADEPDADRWNGLLAGVDLEELDEAPVDPAGADRFTYELRVWTGGGVHAVRYGERSLPEQVRPLVQELLAHARGGDATPGR